MAPTASSAHTAPTIDGVRLVVEECGGDVPIVIEGLILVYRFKVVKTNGNGGTH